jgi:hypothetical protein
MCIQQVGQAGPSRIDSSEPKPTTVVHPLLYPESRVFTSWRKVLRFTACVLSCVGLKIMFRFNFILTHGKHSASQTTCTEPLVS